MKKNFLIVTLFIILIFSFINLNKIQKGLYIFDKNIGLLKSQQIKIFVAENHQENKTILSWSLPNTKLHSHIELYQGDTLGNSYKKNGGGVKYY